MFSIQKEWITYKEACIPEKASEAQFKALHSTYYAGALTVMASFMELKGMTGNQIREHFENIHKELAEFIKEYK